MERRKALAVATAATLVLGAGVVATASVTGASLLGFGGTNVGPGSFAAASPGAKPGVIVRKRDVYDRYVVGAGPAAGPAGSVASNGRLAGAAGPAGASAPAWGTTATPTTVATGAGTDPGVDPGTETSPAAAAPHSPTHHPATGSTTPTTSASEPTDPGTVPPTVPDTEPDTVPPTTPTTVPTTNPQQEIHVPRNWPKGAQLPPIPANCREPQLTWDGVDTSTAVWHCDD